jgi:peptide/nickel transport system permease protein
MADLPKTVTSASGAPAAPRRGGASTLARVARYTTLRLIALFLTVIVGVYLTILIANMGGHVDEIRRSAIWEGVALGVAQSPEFRAHPAEQRTQIISEIVALEEQRLGLDQPFLIRSFTALANALTLDLGRSEHMFSDAGSRMVRLIILERLPPTLLLFATANILLFFIAVFVALYLSRRYGSPLDQAMIALAPTSAAPAWFYGIFLILIFSAFLGLFPFGGMVATPPPREPLQYALSLLHHLVLPVTAIVISAVFLTIYYWRTFFLIHSSEDYVELAKAKGLSDRELERRYILRPTLPTIITSFALTLIGLWTGAIILETVFNWPGLGRLIFRAIGLFDTPVIVGTAVIYAYLLAVTVFLLDIIYALVDPRVKIGTEGSKA